MFLKYKDEKNVYCIVDYMQEDNMFVLRTENEKDFIVVETVLEFSSYEAPEKYEVHMLKNQCASENSIHQVYVGEGRIGWVFPVQALVSKEHTYANDIHFLKYAYAATFHLLDEINDRDTKNQRSSICLTDFYESNSQVLILDKDNIAKINNFSIDDYAVSFFAKGYSFSGAGNIYTELDGIEKHVRIKSLTERLKNASYINILFKELIPIEMEPFAKFHILYQVVEIMINEVFNIEFKKYVEKLDGKTDKLFEEKDKLNDIINEKKRVVLLMNNYTKIPLESSGRLNAICKGLLEHCGSKVISDEENTDVSKNLYAVRCLLVHNFYTLDKELYMNELRRLNDAFLGVIIEMLQTFHVS